MLLKSNPTSSEVKNLKKKNQRRNSLARKIPQHVIDFVGFDTHSTAITLQFLHEIKESSERERLEQFSR